MPCSACGSGDLGDLAAEALDQLQRRLEDLRAHPARRRRAGELGRDREAQPLEVLPARQAVTPPSIPTEVESQGSRALQDGQQQGGVGDVAGQRPALVERGGEGDHPVARDRAVGRLQADDPAERGGLADRAAGVGADRPGRQAAGHRRGRATRGAARHPLPVPGVEHRPDRPSSRSRTPSRTRPCWSCRAPARRPRSAAARRSPCRAAGSPRGSASRPWSAPPRCRRCP